MGDFFPRPSEGMGMSLMAADGDVWGGGAGTLGLDSVRHSNNGGTGPPA